MSVTTDWIEYHDRILGCACGNYWGRYFEGGERREVPDDPHRAERVAHERGWWARDIAGNFRFRKPEPEPPEGPR